MEEVADETLGMEGRLDTNDIAGCSSLFMVSSLCVSDHMNWF